MELILMSLLTIIAMCLGIFIGKIWGKDAAYDIGYDDGAEAGYEDGLEDGMKVNKDIEGFPTTVDGKFFSTEAAIRSMSKGGDD